MSKIEFNTEEQEVVITRRIGRGNESTITLNPEAAGININLGIASIGATTDFGGAISLGIAGQEITWGREGGTIHIGIGGFAVDVEARDCIVTEVKSIFGIIVAQRSYSDPGCTPPKEELPPAPIFDPIKGIELGDGAENVYVVLQGRYSAFERRWYTDTTTFETNVTVSDIPENIEMPSFSPLRPTLLPFTVGEAYKAERVQQGIDGGFIEGRITSRTIKLDRSGKTNRSPMVLSSNQLYYSTRISDYTGTAEATVNGQSAPVWSSVTTPTTIIIYGSKTNCKNYIKTLQSYSVSASGSYSSITTYIVKQVIPVGRQKPPAAFLPTGNKPPIMQSCCEEILDMLEDIKEAFAVDRLLKDKFPVSNSFMAPECDPASVTRAKNYYEIAQCLFRMMAHGMIFEPRVNIKDADAAKAGDQEFKAKYLNATGWASAVAEALLEIRDDGNVSTNMGIRSGFASTQTMVGLADAIYRIDAILDCMGIELAPKIETVETPYNVQIQIGKGFGEGNERQIDLNQDEATEKLLPTFLQVKKNKIKTVDIHPRSRSLKDILESIESNLPGNNNA